jgi:adenosylhomocysteinase
MPVLNIIKNRFEKEKPLKGQTIAACLHVTKETAVLVKVLNAGGAKVALCGSNPLSTQDDVAAALADDGVHVFAWRGQNTEDYYKCIDKVLDFKPTMTMDDGADVVGMIHSKRQNQIKDIKGGTEETSTGVVRLKAMEQDGSLKYPIIAVNDATLNISLTTVTAQAKAPSMAFYVRPLFCLLAKTLLSEDTAGAVAA